MPTCLHPRSVPLQLRSLIVARRAPLTSALERLWLFLLLWRLKPLQPPSTV